MNIKDCDIHILPNDLDLTKESFSYVFKVSKISIFCMILKWDTDKIPPGQNPPW